MENFSGAFGILEKLSSALNSVIKGRNDTIKLVLTGLVADGHVLLEDYPGSGKTTLTKALGRLISAQNTFEPFRRIQFTPDLLPGDVLGVNIFEPKNGSFRFVQGPIFAHVVLADELNRAGPKVQSAFLECMAEKQVTIENHTYKLDELFFVVGTQNPIDVAGTYPLPLVQLDRFLLKVPMPYVDAATEEQILKEHGEIKANAQSLSAVCSREDILACRRLCKSVKVSDALRRAMVEIVQSTRGNNLVQWAASTRAAIMLQDAVRGFAMVNGREFATEDDLVTAAPFALLHRLKFHPGAGEPRKLLREIMNPAIEKLARVR